MENEICKPHTKCRVCGLEELTKYLDLGLIPLANNLEDTQEEAINAERYPLEVMLCENCGLSQLSNVIDPEKLFAYYTYRSSVNGGYIKHCQEMAKTLKQRYDLDEDSFIIDIAGNDGTLLQQFKKEINCDVLNIDPAENLTTISQANGIPAWSVFWGYEIAKAIQGQADIITATNVFAHVDDIEDFLKGAKIALKPEGILVIECPYMGDHLEKMEWTQVYFEHLSYMSIKPIVMLCYKIGLHVRNVEHFDIHGGTIRFYISPTPYPAVPDNIIKYCMREDIGGFNTIDLYKYWAEKVKKSIYDFSMEIGILKIKGSKVAAFAASAKGNTLLNSALLDYKTIDYIVDETPQKQGRYSPGTGLFIHGMDELLINPPDYLIILSWNFKDEIMEKCRKIGYKGKFIIPIPEFQIVD